jgi:phosphoglycerol transferase MdoB-like AlkP superfamily enzyme
LALAYLLFTVTRLIFLFFQWSAFSNADTFQLLKACALGLWFDTSAIMYTFGLFIILHLLPLNIRNHRNYQLLLKILFLFGCTITTLLNLVDVGYFSFSGKRSGFELIKMQSAQNASPLVYVFDFWYLALLLLLLIGLSWKFYPRLKVVSFTQKLKPTLLEILVMLVIGTLSFVGARGSVGLKPLNTMDAANIVGPTLTPLAVNTPFQMLLSIGQIGVEEKTYYTPDELNAFRLTQWKTNDTVPNQGKNVVLIIVESLGKEYVGGYNDGKGYTPFIDSLMQHSQVFTHAYANGKRSIEGIPAIISSLPSWMQGDYINSFYQTNTLHSLGYYLTQQGYDCSFYHGGKNGTMSFDRFVAQTQAGNYYGLNEYPNKQDFDGNWGIPDEPYLQYVASELTQKKLPFFATVFTLSSHHPYKLPKGYETKFTGGTLPIHATIQYADYALMRFFETAKQQPWYANTLFIITADHSSENTLPYYQTISGKYEIPLLIFNPKQLSKQTIETTIDQLQLTPLVLNQVGKANASFFSFANNYAIQYDGGLYQLIQYPFVLQFDGEKSIGWYDLKEDSLMKNNLINKETAQEKRNELERNLKAIIQDYNSRLIHNQSH